MIAKMTRISVLHVGYSAAVAVSHLRRFSFCRSLLNEFDNMVNHLVVGHFVVLLAGQIHHPAARAAAGKPDIRHQRLTGAVHHATDDRQRHRRLEYVPAVLPTPGNRRDHIKTLPRAGRAGNDVHPAMAQA